MIVVRSASEAAEPRKQVIPEEGLITYVTRYFSREVGDLYATATKVEQDPNTTGGAHFHAADQFQVVVDGWGLYGKTPVQRYSVHFAAAYSPYGPIRASAHGLKWFTLRNGRDPGGIKWMPASRDQLHAAKQRPRVVYGEPEIPLQSDGLGAWHVNLAPGERHVGESPVSGRGQFWVVLDGSGTVAGNDFQTDSLLFVAPDEPPVTIEAGAGRFEVLGLQFPRHDT